MGDLISRKNAIEYFMINTNWNDEDGYPIGDWEEKRKLLEEYFSGVPSAQPEIIRCKDCKHFNDGDCTELPKLVSEEDFCSFAERGEDE